MSDDVLQQIGPFRLLRELGRGGMGVVHLAHDTRLDRHVAIKALPEHLACDRDRLARFQREAKVLASLNHPSIGAIYGIEEANGQQYLVLEYIEGETLAQRLERGAMPVDEAIDISIKIAEALEAAHEKAIIHRDLKPGNIMVTPEGAVKVLDFGLARTAEATSSMIAAEDSPTLTSPMRVHSPTIPGAIMGTAGYMSPEQARGKPVDKRSDIFSFGCVLYEMLTGVQPFVGETVSDSIGAVLHKDVDFERLPRGTAPAVFRVLRRCLERDKQQRLRDIGDARLELEAARNEPHEDVLGHRASIVQRAALIFGVAVVALAAGAIGQRLLRMEHAPAAPAIKRFGITGFDMPNDMDASLAISPAGDRIVLRGRDETGRLHLYVRNLDSTELTMIPGSEWGRLPFFSPSGDEVGFFTHHEVKAASLNGGMARSIAAGSRFLGGAWMEDGTILIGSPAPLLNRVSSSGGMIREVQLDPPPDIAQIFSPTRIPGRNAVLCTVERGGSLDIALITLSDGKLRILVENGMQPLYVAGSHIIYQQGMAGPLMALPFDAESLAVTGKPFVVISQVARRPHDHVHTYSISNDGTLVYIPPVRNNTRCELLWIDRSGNRERIVELPRSVATPRLSRDGRRIAFREVDLNCTTWVYDLARGTATLISQGGDNHGVVWMPDDRHVLTCRFRAPDTEEDRRDSSGRTGHLVSMRSDGANEPLILRTDQPLMYADAIALNISREGRYVLLRTERNETGFRGFGTDIIDLEEKALRPLLHSRFDETDTVFSPAGTHIAYASNQSGRYEVYVQPFPALDSRIAVSIDGGEEPAWSRDGKMLYFRRANAIYAVDVEMQANGDLAFGRPTQVVTDIAVIGSFGGPCYDLAEDGRILTVRRSRDGTSEVQFEVILNWFSELERLDPGSVRRD